MKQEGRFHAASSVAGEWVYGVHPVLEALKSGRDIKVIYIARSRHERVVHIMREAEKKGIPVKTADMNFFDSNFPKGHQAVAARTCRRGTVSLQELMLLPGRKKKPPLFIILDCIEDPRNFGAILRSADAAGAHGVVIQSRRSAGLGPEVFKSSAGAVEHIPVAVVPNIKHAINKMKEEDITIICAEAGPYPAPWHIDLKVPLAVVIGSEGRGIRNTVKENCDIIINLPMRGKVNSLNASVAAGIILFETLRQRSDNIFKKQG